jgi:hypothetical protein
MTLNIDENNKNNLFKLFENFLDQHPWTEETKTACVYSFFHTVNLINSNLKKSSLRSDSDNAVNYIFDNDNARLRQTVIDEAILVIQGCELPTPNVQRIRVDEAVGALLNLK